MNELENKIVDEYVNKLLDKYKNGFEKLNSFIGKDYLDREINKIIVQHLGKENNDFSIYSYVEDGINLLDKLKPLVKTQAIKEFMDKVNVKV